MKTITYNPKTHVLVPVDSEPAPDFRGYAALGTGQYLLNACPATEVLPAELVISIATEEEKACRVIGDLKYVEPGTEIDPSSMAVRLAFFSVSGLDALEQQLRILREESFPNTIPQPDRTAELEAATPQPEPVDSEPAMWVMKHIRSGDLTQAKPNQKALHPYMWSDAFPRYTTPQPDRVAELEAALKVARDGIDKVLVANDPTEFGCACDLSVGYLCGPCHADMQQQPLKSALAKINEVLK